MKIAAHSAQKNLILNSISVAAGLSLQKLGVVISPLWSHAFSPSLSLCDKNLQHLRNFSKLEGKYLENSATAFGRGPAGTPLYSVIVCGPQQICSQPVTPMDFYHDKSPSPSSLLDIIADQNILPSLAQSKMIHIATFLLLLS